MWPFVGDSALWLLLYVLTWALHFVFVGYVLVGTGYAFVQAVRRADTDPIAEHVRDRLPFMLGCGITAGVAPLLFLQLLYQRHFYTANLLLGPRWGAVVPALIVGFYALYLAKALSHPDTPTTSTESTATTARRRRQLGTLALGVGTACFLFVAWSWTEIHELMRDEPAWVALYAAGDRFYTTSSIAPRLLLWLGAFAALFATVAIWWETGRDRKRLAIVALVGHALAGGGIAWLAASGTVGTHGWSVLFGTGAAASIVGWLWLVRDPDGVAAYLVAGATTAALVAGAVVREAPRLAMIETPREDALSAGGFWVFAATAVFAVAAIAWIWRTIKRAAKP